MSEKRGLYVRLAILVGVTVLSAGGGLWLGNVTAPDYLPAYPAGAMPSPHAQTHLSLEEQVYIDPDAPPLFFFAGAAREENWPVVLAEVRMAAKAGIHQYILPVSLPWDGAVQQPPALDLLRRVIEADPRAVMLLHVDLNPPETWLDTHPGEGMMVRGERQNLASVASVAWAEDSVRGLTGLVASLQSGGMQNRIIGYVLAALSDGRWYHPGGFDVSGANRKGFQTWLKRRYGTEEALRAAWNNDTAAFDSAVIPERPGASATASVFLDLPRLQPCVDFLRYTSESTADAIAAFAVRLKDIAGAEAKVLAPYGYTFELLSNDAGHFALGALLDSDLDGFMSPVSYVDRGLGGTGGMMGPVDSAHYHGQQWYLVDDTRTGIARDDVTGKVTHMKGLRAEDVHNVQRRNFAAAVIHGLGLVWSDPLGDGWLHDTEQWEEFAAMRRIYAELYPVERKAPEAEGNSSRALRRDEASKGGAADEEAASLGRRTNPDASGHDAGQDDAATADALTEGFDETLEEAELEPLMETEAETEGPLVEVPWGAGAGSGLAVVVDEASRFYLCCETRLNELLLHRARDAALRAGMPTQFCLLQDVLDDIAPAASVYLFLNAFRLSGEDRARLHARLARDRSCAIWLYAPGYIDVLPEVGNVTATTRMNVGVFEGPGKTGSVFALAGRLLKQDESFGPVIDVAPLFYVDDPEADVLSLYRVSKQPSIAMRVLKEGWTSVYVAEPALSAKLLREILMILEQPLHYRPTTPGHFPTVHIGEGLLAVHARRTGEGAVDLGFFCDVADLFDPSIGWPEKDSFLLRLKTGETRLLKLTPL